jgi:hydroxylamine reductase (hybrid-cluster protein)
MQNKQVILDKIEYDAMENQLKELKAILESRTVVRIIERHQLYRTGGMTTKYILGKDNDTATQELAAKVNQQINELQQLKQELSTSKRELLSSNKEITMMTNEIIRLNNLNKQKQKWYHKLLGKK